MYSKFNSLSKGVALVPHLLLLIQDYIAKPIRFVPLNVLLVLEFNLSISKE